MPTGPKKRPAASEWHDPTAQLEKRLASEGLGVSFSNYGEYEPQLQGLFADRKSESIPGWALDYVLLYSGCTERCDETLPYRRRKFGKGGKVVQPYYGLAENEHYLMVSDRLLKNFPELDEVQKLAWSQMRGYARPRKGGVNNRPGYCNVAVARLAMDLGVSSDKIERARAKKGPLRNVKTITADSEVVPFLIYLGPDHDAHSGYDVPSWKWTKRERTYALIVPLWILRRWELSSVAKLVWGVLRYDAQPERYGGKVNELGAGYACVNRMFVASQLGITAKQVKDALKELRGHHLIELQKERGSNGRAIYRLLSHRWRTEYLSAAEVLRLASAVVDADLERSLDSVSA
jgi:hypothetical protein